MAAPILTGLAFNGQDLTGKSFGRLTVLSLAGVTQQWGKRGQRTGRTSHWNCICECGTAVTVMRNSLTDGKTKSCGCLMREVAAARQRTHGGAVHSNYHPLYRVWNGMKNRCRNANDTGWKNYGGRGIAICIRWQNDFVAFLDDMFQTWRAGLTIDRKDNNGNYSCGKCDECLRNGWPANCRWITQAEQQLNTSRSRFLTFRGKTQTMKEWSTELNIPYQHIARRLYRGLPIETVLASQ